MEFEFDRDKSLSNKKKHGINFEEAQDIWKDNDLVRVPSKHSDEDRFLFIGIIAEKHYAAIVTYRNERIRIISVRRARQEEVDFYESRRA